MVLSRADIGAVYALHRETIAALPNPGAVRPDAPSFFEEIFDSGGEIMGLFAEEEGMVAYGVVRPELARERDRVALDKVVPEDMRLFVLDGTAVKPSHWRRGLQRHIVGLRIERAAAHHGAGAVIAKASPGNVPSMRNLMKCGFAIVGRIEKSYGWRYIHYRPVARGFAEPVGGTWVEAAAIEEAQRRFDGGEVARECAADAEGVAKLRFVAPAF